MLSGKPLLQSISVIRLTLTDYMYQEKRDEKVLPALPTALTHRYNDLKTTAEK